MNKLNITLVAFTTLALSSTAAFALDDAARTALLKDSKCMKCHAADKEKTGPSFKKTAEKYKGKADGEKKVIDQMTKEPKYKTEDGTEEKHAAIKSTNEADIKAVATWILAQ